MAIFPNLFYGDVVYAQDIDPEKRYRANLNTDLTWKQILPH